MLVYCIAIIIVSPGMDIVCLNAQTATASVTVNVNKILGPVNRFIFGTNMLGYQKGAWSDATPDYSNRGGGIWDPMGRIPVSQMVQLAKDAGVSIARWPGGCAVHLFDWKKTVGPLDKRPDQQFGLPEFLTACAAMNAVPVITVSDYYGAPQDAADLVEYLNAPDDGRHRWAALRTADGATKPWNVIWFEYGNETYHGDHHDRKMSRQEYANNYLAYQAAMKAVDPQLKLGAVLEAGPNRLNSWARPVLQVIGQKVDFLVYHCYVSDYSRNDGKPDPDTLFRIALAGADQVQDFLDKIHSLSAELCSGRNVPVGVTEFNGWFLQDKPVPYRFSLGNALINAEMLNVFLKPGSNIAFANFWQFSNEYFGAVRGYAYKHEVLLKRPPYYTFQLYSQHFGSDLVDVKVECDNYATETGFGVSAARGAGRELEELPGKTILRNEWTLGKTNGVEQRVDSGRLIVDFAGNDDLNYYHATQTIPAEPNMAYHFVGWIKTEGITSKQGVCFQIGDARGWTLTKSVSLTPDIGGSQDWMKVETDYTTLQDTKAITVAARRVSGGGVIQGRSYFRGESLTGFLPKVFPAVPYLSVTASKSTIPTSSSSERVARSKVYLMIVNKEMGRTIKTSLWLDDFLPDHASAWMLTGPAVDSTNEHDSSRVAVKYLDLGRVKNGFVIELPPHSLTALEIQ